MAMEEVGLFWSMHVLQGVRQGDGGHNRGALSRCYYETTKLFQNARFYRAGVWGLLRCVVQLLKNWVFFFLDYGEVQEQTIEITANILWLQWLQFTIRYKGVTEIKAQGITYNEEGLGLSAECALVEWVTFWLAEENKVEIVLEK